jgi:dimethylpropiothetin dethiomethylase
MRLGDVPDWLYILREYDGVYRRGSAGGSKPIRAHQRRVRELISRIVAENPELRPGGGRDKPVTAHLGRALDNAATGPLSGLARALQRAHRQLDWEWGYDRIAERLAERYAYAEILGPRGPVVSDRLILGLVLFAPDTTYPQHAHHDIEESYISVSGSWSENDAAVYAPGSLILNRSGSEHRITTGNQEPCLLAYAWVAPPEVLAEPQMRFSRPRR